MYIMLNVASDGTARSAAQERFHDAVWELFYDNMARYLAGQPLKNLRTCQYCA